jgi:hypothetical protein
VQPQWNSCHICDGTRFTRVSASSASRSLPRNLCVDISPLCADLFTKMSAPDSPTPVKNGVDVALLVQQSPPLQSKKVS